MSGKFFPTNIGSGSGILTDEMRNERFQEYNGAEGHAWTSEEGWGFNHVLPIKKNMTMTAERIIFEYESDCRRLKKEGGIWWVLHWTPEEHRAKLKLERERLMLQPVEKLDYTTVKSISPDGIFHLVGHPGERIGIIKNIFDSDHPEPAYAPLVSEFNRLFKDLVNHSNSPLKKMGDRHELLGLTIPVFIIGRELTCSSVHREDESFPSINGFIDGSCALWVIIHPNDGEDFIKLMKTKTGQRCHNVLDGKYYAITPRFLTKNKIRFNTILQYPGDFIGANIYHCVFNIGFCIKIACNFLPYEFGLEDILAHKYCECSSKCENTGCGKWIWRADLKPKKNLCMCNRPCETCGKWELKNEKSKGSKYCACPEKVVSHEHGQRLTGLLKPFKKACQKWKLDNFQALVDHMLQSGQLFGMAKNTEANYVNCAKCEFRSHPKNIKRHMKIHESKKIEFPCKICEKKYSNLFGLARHVANKHNTAAQL